MCRISAHNKMSELLNRNTDPLFEKMEKIFKERDVEVLIKYTFFIKEITKNEAITE